MKLERRFVITGSELCDLAEKGMKAGKNQIGSFLACLPIEDFDNDCFFNLGDLPIRGALAVPKHVIAEINELRG